MSKYIVVYFAAFIAIAMLMTCLYLVAAFVAWDMTCSWFGIRVMIAVTFMLAFPIAWGYIKDNHL